MDAVIEGWLAELDEVCSTGIEGLRVEFDFGVGEIGGWIESEFEGVRGEHGAALGQIEAEAAKEIEDLVGVKKKDFYLRGRSGSGNTPPMRALGLLNLRRLGFLIWIRKVRLKRSLTPWIGPS